MKPFIKLICLIILIRIGLISSLAQVSPYQIPPKWMFGYKSGLNFGTSPYTSSPPTFLAGNPTDNSGGTDAVGGIEASTAICDQSSNLVMYCNQLRYYNSANTSTALPSVVSTGSSTDGVVAIPYPTATGPSTTQYYLFTANDQTGGGGGINQGVNYFVYNSTTNTMSAKTNLIGNVVDESLCAGSDGNGGYWIVAHGYNSASYYVWHVTSAGVAQHATFPQSPGGVTQFGNNSTVKISRCQDRIAYIGNNTVEVYNWNMSTGTIGSSIVSKSGVTAHSYGLEFSPSGRFVYVGDLNSINLYQIDANTPASAPVVVYPIASSTTPTAVNGTASTGTMQLGPDNKIYVSLVSGTGNTNAVYIGVISSPDVLDTGGGPTTGCQYDPRGYTLKPNNGAAYPNYFLGLANMAWMTPKAPAITTSSGGTCSKVTHTIDFKTYFGTAIDVLNSSVQWSFDNGATYTTAGSNDGTGSINPFTHDYGGSVSTTAKVKFKDQSCNNFTWTASVSVTTSCPAPVELMNFNAIQTSTGNLLTWSTASELNNKYFEILRSSDGIHFTSIGTVMGSGTTNSLSNYRFNDYSPMNGINYYKLVQYDYDGKNNSSEIVSVTNDNVLFTVYPNPSTSDFKVKISKGTKGFIKVNDVTGKEILTIEIADEQSELSLGQNWAEGVYVIHYVTDSFVTSTRVFKSSK